MKKGAIVLSSGGLDSTTLLAQAQNEGFEIISLSFDYGQRHRSELQAASNIAKAFNVKSHLVFSLSLNNFGGSALTDHNLAVPETESSGIPITYVPARNTVFLSIALALAEAKHIHDIFIGVNAVDYSGYPDCRPDFIEAFEKLANLATRDGREGKHFRIHSPLIKLSKAEIIQKGISLGIDYSITVSCYQADEDGRACGVCDSCRIRREGFASAQHPDPTRYRLV